MGNLFDMDPGRDAVISGDGLYRYTLTRFTAPTGGRLNFLMLNPSTADAFEDDPTIRRCLGFARSWGYGELIVTNLFAFRATDPKGLRRAQDAIGPENDVTIMRAAREADRVVCAWGSDPIARERGRYVRRMLGGAGIRCWAIRVNKLGDPAHPLYLPAGLTPVNYDLAPSELT
jgi:hypothetical protein